MKRTKLPNKDSFDFLHDLTNAKGLSGRFICPPFSVLHAANGDWQKRKREWLSLGIESEVGRKEGLLTNGKIERGREKKEEFETGKPVWIGSTTSVFDPVLCELMYSWFCPEGGQVVDPFAGGSVRGIVASWMGLQYWGSELREEQVLANIRQGKKITPKNEPLWLCGDAFQLLRQAPMADFIFSCPPYGDMEVYSDLKEDLSNQTYDEFLISYKKIIRRACFVLKQNRFACFVVMNYRNKRTGFLYDFVGETIKCFEAFSTYFYNNIILLTPTGSLPLRTGRQFHATRKVGSAHQVALIFYKGDTSKIKMEFNH